MASSLRSSVLATRPKNQETQNGFFTTFTGVIINASTTTGVADPAGPYNQFEMENSGPPNNNQVFLNGVVTPSNQVLAIAYNNHACFQENTSNNWWYWATSSSSWIQFFIQAVGMTGTTYTLGALANTVIGTIQTTMSDGSNFQGTYTLGGANASQFFLNQNLVQANTTLTQNSYSITITATPTNVGQPFTSAPIAITAAASANNLLPLKASTNGHYLVNQQGTPVIFVVAQAQNIFTQESTANANTYWQLRASQGFTADFCDLINSFSPSTGYWTGNQAANTFDGLNPFPTNSFYAPNLSYFTRMDQMIQTAASQGITIILNVVDQYAITNIPWINSSNTAAFAAFGTFVGNRYKNFPNIIYMFGNDYGGQFDTQYVAMFNALMIQDANTHLVTGELSPPELSLDDTNWAGIANLNWSYDYCPAYFPIARGYNASPGVPVFMGEAQYENVSSTANGTTFVAGFVSQLSLRSQSWWTMTSGGAGFAFGTAGDFTPDGSQTVGLTYQTYCVDFFNALQWWKLVPDISIPCTYGAGAGSGGAFPSAPVITGHNFITAGFGLLQTPGGINAVPKQDNPPINYVSSAVASDGSFAVAYLPATTTITANLAKINGTGVIAQWFDPTGNTYTTVTGSPFANTLTGQTFTSPGLNATSNTDWVLLFTANNQPTTITSVTLSNNGFTGGSPSGTVVGSISVGMSFGTFNGSLSLTGTNASDFQIVGNNLETNGVVPNGTYNFNIVATQTGAGGSPFTQAETITGTTGSSESPDGTAVTTVGPFIIASATPGSPGTNMNVAITSGAQLNVNGSIITNTARVIEIYKIGESVFQENSSNAWFGYIEPGNGGTLGQVNDPHPAISINNASITTGASGTYIGTFATVTGGASGYTWRYSLSGTNAADFTTSGSNLLTNVTLTNGTYGPFTVTATPTPNIINGPFTTQVSVTVAIPGSNTESPDGTLVTNTTSFIIASSTPLTHGNNMVVGITSGAQVETNGSTIANTGSVIAIYKIGEAVFQENSSENWFGYIVPGNGGTLGQVPNPQPTVAISGTNITSGATGTVVGAITTTTGAGSYSWAYSLSGTNANLFNVSGGNLVVASTLSNGSYGPFTITATPTPGIIGGPFTLQVTVTVGGSGVTTPPQAANVGYTTLVLNADFAAGSIVSTDQSGGTVAPLYNWNQFTGAQTLPASGFNINNGVLEITEAGGITLNPTEAFGQGISTACGPNPGFSTPGSIAQNNGFGLAFHLGYFEGVIGWDFSNGGNHTFWMNYIDGPTSTDYTEMDISETFSTFSPGQTSFHQWSPNQQNSSPFNVPMDAPSSAWNIGAAGVITYNKVGLLWTPTFCQAFVNDVGGPIIPMNTNFQWNAFGVNPPQIVATGTINGYGGASTSYLYLQMGIWPGASPLYIQTVRVWQ